MNILGFSVYCIFSQPKMEFPPIPASSYVGSTLISDWVPIQKQGAYAVSGSIPHYALLQQDHHEIQHFLALHLSPVAVVAVE